MPLVLMLHTVNSENLRSLLTRLFSCCCRDGRCWPRQLRIALRGSNRPRADPGLRGSGKCSIWNAHAAWLRAPRLYAFYCAACGGLTPTTCHHHVRRECCAASAIYMPSSLARLLPSNTAAHQTLVHKACNAMQRFAEARNTSAAETKDWVQPRKDRVALGRQGSCAACAALESCRGPCVNHYDFDFKIG